MLNRYVRVKVVEPEYEVVAPLVVSVVGYLVTKHRVRIRSFLELSGASREDMEIGMVRVIIKDVPINRNGRYLIKKVYLDFMGCRQDIVVGMERVFEMCSKSDLIGFDVMNMGKIDGKMVLHVLASELEYAVSDDASMIDMEKAKYECMFSIAARNIRTLSEMCMKRAVECNSGIGPTTVIEERIAEVNRGILMGSAEVLFRNAWDWYGCEKTLSYGGAIGYREVYCINKIITHEFESIRELRKTYGGGRYESVGIDVSEKFFRNSKVGDLKSIVFAYFGGISISGIADMISRRIGNEFEKVYIDMRVGNVNEIFVFEEGDITPMWLSNGVILMNRGFKRVVDAMNSNATRREKEREVLDFIRRVLKYGNRGELKDVKMMYIRKVLSLCAKNRLISYRGMELIERRIGVYMRKELSKAEKGGYMNMRLGPMMHSKVIDLVSDIETFMCESGIYKE